MPGRDHARKDGTRTGPCPLQIDGESALPFGRIGLQRRVKDIDPRIVDQPVKVPPLRQRRVGKDLRDPVGIRDIGRGVQQGAAGQVGQLGGGMLQRRPVDIEQEQIRAFGPELCGDRLTDALRCPGHGNEAAGQSSCLPYHSATDPSAWRHRGLRHRWPMRTASITRSSSISMPRPGPWGMSTMPFL